jgi:hypothetical protein
MPARLTFDAHPKELATRSDGMTRISLLWSRRTHRAAVVVEDDETGETVELDVQERDNPLDVYEHALAYAPRRGHPGRPAAMPRLAA